MADVVPRYYWDTSVFLSLINNKTEPNRHLVCVDILKHAEQGRIVLCTSMITIAEVIRPKGIAHPTPLTPDQVTKLEGMFQWPWLKKYQVDEPLAFRAARIARDCGLKPIDAIHAATALIAAVDILQKWDRDYSRIAHLVSVEEPAYLTKLPLIDSTLEEASSDADAPPSSAPVKPSGQSRTAPRRS